VNAGAFCESPGNHAQNSAYLITVWGGTSLVRMTTDSTCTTPITLLGLGDMGTALARAWLAAGHPLTVWNRSSP